MNQIIQIAFLYTLNEIYANYVDNHRYLTFKITHTDQKYIMENFQVCSIYIRFPQSVIIQVRVLCKQFSFIERPILYPMSRRNLALYERRKKTLAV